MAQWYYSDEERNRHGPLDAAAMAQLHERGELRPDTLVWRDGLGQWQPWRELAGELVAAPGFAPIADPASDERAGAERTAAAVAAAMAQSEARREPQATASAPVADARIAADTGPDPADAAPADPHSPYTAPRTAVAEGSQVVQGQPVVAAGFWRRVAAYLIDSTLVGTAYYAVATVLFIAVFMFGLAGSSQNWLTGGDALSIIVSVISLGSYALISLCYYAGLESSSMQATLGKAAVGIKVVDAHGGRLSRGRALARWAASGLSYLSLGVGFLMTAFTERKRGLHDMVARTEVVDRWAYTTRAELQRQELGVVTWVVLALGGLIWLGVIGFVVGAALLGLR